MDFIIKDDQTGVVLYGIVALKEIQRTGRARRLKMYEIPAEAWIAFLKTQYDSVPEVRAYLQVIETEGINPRQGALLEAIDQSVEVSEDEIEALAHLVDVDDEGEEWKREE